MSDSSRLSASSSLRALVKLAREAANGWACYAKRPIELNEIGRIHRALDELSAALDAQQEPLEMQNHSLREGSSVLPPKPEATPNAGAIRALVQDLDFAIDATEPRDVILRRFADILERSPLWR
jgi:hypothetical protein